MKLFQLQYFQVSCQYNNITKAAEHLHVSQPSITNAIKSLEEEFNVKLFHRLNKGFTLTREGQTLLERANEVLQSADYLQQVMRDLVDNRNLIRLGVPPMIGTFLFPRVYKGFKATYPHVSITTQEYGSRQLMDLLDNNVIDLAIVPSNDVVSDHYRIAKISLEETVFCVSSESPFAGRTSVCVEEIKDEPLILFSEGFYLNDEVTRRFRAIDCTPNTIHISSQLNTIKEFIKNDNASGFMFRSIADQEPHIIPISLNPPINVKISLVWRKSSYLFSDMLHFIQYCKLWAEENHTLDSKE